MFFFVCFLFVVCFCRLSQHIEESMALPEKLDARDGPGHQFLEVREQLVDVAIAGFLEALLPHLHEIINADRWVDDTSRMLFRPLAILRNKEMINNNNKLAWAKNGYMV